MSKLPSGSCWATSAFQPRATASLQAEAAESAAKTAAETAPEIPLATHLGELGARSRADQESLLDWLRLLVRLGADVERPLREQKEIHLKTMAALVKGVKDQPYVFGLVEKGEWGE